MVELIQVVNDAAVLGHRLDRVVYHGLGLLDRDRAGLVCFLEDIFSRMYHAVIFLHESIAAIEDTGDCLIVFAEFVFILDVDDWYIKEAEPCDMRFGQKRIFRQHDNQLFIDDRAGQYHARL